MENKSHAETIARLNQEIRDQQETFDQAGDPDFDKFKKFEHNMKKELVELGKSLKESLVKEIHEKHKLIEEKLTSKQDTAVTEPWHIQSGDQCKYASSSTTTQPLAAVDFRAIIQEQQKQQTDEINDQRSRACNIVIHGVKEAPNVERSEAKKFDEDFVRKLKTTMAIENLRIKTVNWIGA